MGHVIAVSGKGGVGKTTLCGLLIQYLCENGKHPVLAVDADANANLNEVLGVEPEITLGELREEIERAGVDPRYQIPTGITKQAYMTETLRPVLTYIQKHHSESVTIEQLAKIAHMSSSYFMSCFKQNFGLGAIEYLNQVRIRSACDLLRNTDRSISDIAFDTGFHNLSNFNRQFRTKVGCSPQTYRKESVLS